MDLCMRHHAAPKTVRKYMGHFFHCQQCVSQMALVVKNAPANAGDIRGGVRDTGLIPGLGRYPGYTLVLLPGESHGQRILWTEEPGRLWSTGSRRVGYDCKRLSTASSPTMSMGVAGIDEQGPETLNTLWCMGQRCPRKNGPAPRAISVPLETLFFLFSIFCHATWHTGS